MCANHPILDSNHNLKASCMVEKLTFSTIIWSEEDMYVAWCPDVDVASQGKSVKEALNNLKEAIELYLEDEDAIIPKERSTTILTTVSVEHDIMNVKNVP